MERVKEELQKVIFKLSTQIEKSHASGKIPSDYSLGFANGAIFFEHMLSQKEGGPRFFDRTTSIGTLPVPVALREKEHIEKEYNSIAERARTQEQMFLQENIITQARGVIEALEKIQAFEQEAADDNRNAEPPKELVRGFTIGLGAVKKAILELDHVMTKQEEARHVHKQQQLAAAAQQASASVEPIGNEGQEGMGSAESSGGNVEAPPMDESGRPLKAPAKNQT